MDIKKTRKRDNRLCEIRDGKKQCRLCGQWKSIDLFGRFLEKKKAWKAKQKYINSRCKKCASKATMEWSAKNAERIKKTRKKWKDDLYDRFYEKYGSMCECCGESERTFLTIDHINNDGHIERKSTKNSVLKLIRMALEEHRDDLRVLCWNCNCGRQRNNGICPHQEK